MELSQSEAQQSLQQIEHTMESTARRILGDEAFPFFMLWGAIWFACPVWIHFWPATAAFALLLFPLGGIASWYIGLRVQRPIKSSNDKRYGMLWWILLGFAAIWAVLLRPDSPEQGYAFACTVAMFAYVAGGLWWGRFFVILGVTVTLLTLAALFLLPEYFWLCMAFMGGGALIGSGLYLKFFRS